MGWDPYCRRSGAARVGRTCMARRHRSEFGEPNDVARHHRRIVDHEGADPGMIIPTIDTGLEALLRERLPLPATLGDISFESPSGTWSAQLSRITVNLFLFGVGRSTQQPRPATGRLVDGRK